MNISDSLDQYTDICRDAIKKSSAKLNNSFEYLLIEILLLYMIIPRKINYTQMERYGNYCEQTYRSNFNRNRSECINWLSFNLSLAKRSLDMDGLLAIAIDPCYISKAGKKTAHIGTFWSDSTSSVRLLLQRILLCTERGEGHDEGERAAIFHGLIYVLYEKIF